MADVNLWPEHKARLEGETERKKNRRDATDHHGKSNELLMLLCIRKGVKNVLSLYLIKSWNSFSEIYLHIYNTY